MRRHCLLSAFLILLTAAPLRSQDLEAFDLETIVDPRILTLQAPEGEVELGFFGAYLRSGYANDLQLESRDTREGVAFVDLVTTFIQRRWQVTGRFTGFEGLPDAGASEPQAGRFKLGIGRYLLSEEGTARLSIGVGRGFDHALLEAVTWSVDYETVELAETEPELFPFDSILRVHYEYFDPVADEAAGEALPSVPVTPEHRVALAGRSRNRPGDQILPPPDFSVEISAVHAGGSTRWDTVRGEVRSEVRLWKDRLRIYAVYAVAYRLSERENGRWTNHELSFFIHVPVVTRAFRRPW